MANYIPQYWQLCVTCKAGANKEERQCSYCKTHRQEQNPPRPNIHFSIATPARRDRLGRTRGRPSWDVFLQDRRIAHVYHNRHEWIYSFTSNPYRLFSANFPASKLGEINAFAAVADHIHKIPTCSNSGSPAGGFNILNPLMAPSPPSFPSPFSREKVGGSKCSSQTGRGNLRMPGTPSSGPRNSLSNTSRPLTAKRRTGRRYRPERIIHNDTPKTPSTPA